MEMGLKPVTKLRPARPSRAAARPTCSKSSVSKVRSWAGLRPVGSCWMTREHQLLKAELQRCGSGLGGLEPKVSEVIISPSLSCQQFRKILAANVERLNFAPLPSLDYHSLEPQVLPDWPSVR